MEVALIPPSCLLRETARTDYRLLLPELCNDSNYQRAFKRPGCRYRGFDTYVIMDNGAAEGKTVRPEVLFDYAAAYNANEIVCPDTLGNSEQTVQQVTSFLRHASHASKDKNYYPAFGAVVQGNSMATAKRSVDRYIELNTIGDAISVLYLPRLLLAACETVTARLRLAEYIQVKTQGAFMIHFLGASKLYPKEVYKASLVTPYVRSIDTSLPFVYTYYGKSMANESVDRSQLDRPNPYFFARKYLFDSTLSHHNVETYLEWAKVGEFFGA